MKSNHIITFCILLLTTSFTSNAASTESDTDKINITPTALLMLDAAGYAGNDSEQFQSGVAIPDVRIGVQASFCGSWFAKIDIKYANKQIAPCDIYLQYTFDKQNQIKIGSFIYQFGLQSAYAAFLKSTYETPAPDIAMSFDRLLGIQYQHTAPCWLFAGAVHAGPKAIQFNAAQLGRSEWGVLFRTLWRPRHSDGNIVQFGISGAANTAQNLRAQDKRNYYDISVPFPTQVSKVTAASVNLEKVTGVYRFTPDFLIATGRWAFETQYYLLNVQRKDALPSFTTQGGYGYIRFLARGSQFHYNSYNGGIAIPGKGEVEIVGGVDYVSLSDHTIHGGRLLNASVTGNWFINKYLTWRLRAGYSHRTNRVDTENIENFTFETRLMFRY